MLHLSASQTPWWAVPLTSGILTFLTAAFGAWWGGKLSVQREIEKFSKQRAFDHRLDWYIRAVRTLGEVQFRHVEFLRALAKKDDQGSRIVREKIVDLMPRFDGDIREALLFASPSTVRTLNMMYQRMTNIMESGGSETADAQIRNELAKAYEALSQDVRGHLSLEDLTSEDLAPSANTKR